MPEITHNGICIPRGKKFWRMPGDYQYIPFVDDIDGALEELHDLGPIVRESNAAEGRDFIVDNYSIPVVEERHWRPFLTWLEEGLVQMSFDKRDVAEAEAVIA